MEGPKTIRDSQWWMEGRCVKTTSQIIRIGSLHMLRMEVGVVEVLSVMLHCR